MLPAHGIGSRADLPLPFAVAVGGAAVVLVLTFVLLAVLWRTPRLDGAHAGWPVPSPVAAVIGSRATLLTLGALGLLFTAWVVVSMVWGPQDARNPLPWVIYVLLWVGLVPLSLLLGPTTWARLNPIRSVHAFLTRAAGLDPKDGVRPYPAAWGWWPGALILLAFVWLELVAPDNAEVSTLRLVVLLYLVLQLLAGFVWGGAWFEHGDAFEVWSQMFGRLSALGRRDDGTLVLRSPLAGLDQLRPAPGLVATVSVMLGSTAYDSVREHPAYVAVVQSAPGSRVLADSAALLAVVGLVAALLLVTAAAAAALARVPARGLATQLAPSVVPVALGYVVAHYYSFLVLEGQTAFLRLSDPLGTGADLLGLGGRAVDPTLVEPTLTATVQVCAIVVGHVLGVVLAHDRAVRLFPRRHAVLGQLPLLALMVAYTCAGLLLLFAA